MIAIRAPSTSPASARYRAALTQSSTSTMPHVAAQPLAVLAPVAGRAAVVDVDDREPAAREELDLLAQPRRSTARSARRAPARPAAGARRRCHEVRVARADRRARARSRRRRRERDRPRDRHVRRVDHLLGTLDSASSSPAVHVERVDGRRQRRRAADEQRPPPVGGHLDDPRQRQRRAARRRSTSSESQPVARDDRRRSGRRRGTCSRTAPNTHSGAADLGLQRRQRLRRRGRGSTSRCGPSSSAARRTGSTPAATIASPSDRPPPASAAPNSGATYKQRALPRHPRVIPGQERDPATRPATPAATSRSRARTPAPAPHHP